MSNANTTTIAPIPVPPTYDSNWNLIKAMAGGITALDPNALDPGIVKSHTSLWVPEMSGWDVEYDEQGPATAKQTWLADYNVSTKLLNSSGTVITQLPQAVRQLQSWNRELFQPFITFFDTLYNPNYSYSVPTMENPIAMNLSKPLVPVRVRISPRPDLLDQFSEDKANSVGDTTLSVMSRVPSADTNWNDATGEIVNTGDYLSSIRIALAAYANDVELLPERPVFPRMRSQYYQVDIQYARDEYVNRYGIRYAKVQLRPSVRMLTLKNIPVAVVPTGGDGQPDFKSLYQVVGVQVPGEAAGTVTPAQLQGQAQVTGMILEKVDTGFPVRESLIEYRVTYPWVSLEQLLLAGPIGNSEQLTKDIQANVTPFEIPDGQYLGAVNEKSFLGYSRGHVLYNGCELEEVQSPVTGKIGYKVTHEFLVNPVMEWNQVRYTGSYNPIIDPNNPNEPLANPGNAIAFRTGYMCMQPLNTNPNYVQNNQNWTQFTPLYTVKLAWDNNYHAIYPYPYIDFNSDSENGYGLLYYGVVGDPASDYPRGEG